MATTRIQLQGSNRKSCKWRKLPQAAVQIDTKKPIEKRSSNTQGDLGSSFIEGVPTQESMLRGVVAHPVIWFGSIPTYIHHHHQSSINVKGNSRLAKDELLCVNAVKDEGSNDKGRIRISPLEDIKLPGNFPVDLSKDSLININDSAWNLGVVASTGASYQLPMSSSMEENRQASSSFAVKHDSRDCGFGFSTSQLLVENINKTIKPMECDLHQELEAVGVQIDRNLSNYFLAGSSKLLKTTSGSSNDDLDGEGICITKLVSPPIASLVLLDEITENKGLSSTTYKSVPSLTSTHENAAPEMLDFQEDFNIVRAVPTESPKFLNSIAISSDKSDVFHINDHPSTPEEPSMQENELNLDSEKGRTASHQPVELLAVIGEGVADLHESYDVTDFHRDGHLSPIKGNTHLSPALEQYVKPDEANFYDGRFDSAQLLAACPKTHIDIGGTANDDVGIPYQSLDEHTEDPVHTLEMVSHCVNPDAKSEDSAEVCSHVEMVELNPPVLEDTANPKMDECFKEGSMFEELSDDDLREHVLSSRSQSVGDSKSECLLMSDEKEFNVLQMDELGELVSVEPIEDRGISEIDEQLVEDNSCQTVLMGVHVDHDSDEQLDPKTVVVNSPTGVLENSEGDFDVHGHAEIENAEDATCIEEIPVETGLPYSHMNERLLVNNDIASNGVDETNSMLNNVSADEIVGVPSLMPQSEEHLLEGRQMKTSGEDSSEVVDVLESPPAESSQTTNFIVQHEMEDLFNFESQGIVLVDEIQVNSATINLVQESESYIEEQVEDRVTSAIMDGYKISPIEKPGPYGENYGSEFQDPLQKIHPGLLCSDSGHRVHSSFVEDLEVSRSEAGIERVGQQIDGNESPAQLRYCDSNSNTEVLNILEEAVSDAGTAMPDHDVASFSDDLFTPCTCCFQKIDGEIECDTSLTTEELLRLSFSEVGKHTGLQKCVPYPVADLNEIAARDSTQTEANVHIISEGNESYKQHNLESFCFIDESRQNYCLAVPQKDNGSIPPTEYVVATHEVDGANSSSSSSIVDGNQMEGFEGPNSSICDQIQPELAATSSRFISEFAAIPEGFNSKEDDCHMPTEFSEFESSDWYQIESESSGDCHSSSAVDAVGTVKSNQNVISIDEIPGAKDEMSNASVDEDFPFPNPEYHDQAYSESNESSILLSPHIPEDSTSSKTDNRQQEIDQVMICRSVGRDFHFRGARKLVDQFEECVAKEAEETRKDGTQYEQVKLSARILMPKRTSFHECCGVWDWLRGFRG